MLVKFLLRYAHLLGKSPLHEGNRVVNWGPFDIPRAVNQDSRKAIIELLFLALYQDDRLSLAEDEVLSAALESLGWDSPQPREICVLTAFGLARKASSCAIQAEQFLVERIAVIQQSGGSATALTLLSRVLAADGLTWEEERFLSKIEKQLFP